MRTLLRQSRSQLQLKRSRERLAPSSWGADQVKAFATSPEKGMLPAMAEPLRRIAVVGFPASVRAIPAEAGHSLHKAAGLSRRESQRSCSPAGGTPLSP